MGRSFVLTYRMHQEHHDLYQTAMARLAVSEDEVVERLRRATTSAIPSYESTGPEILASQQSKDIRWGERAFENLRSTGFIRSDWSKFIWYRPTQREFEDCMDRLAGFEAAAIIRLASMDCAPARPTWQTGLEEFLEATSETDAVKACLAHQRLMTAIVAATGEQQLFEGYAKESSAAVTYAMAHRVDRKDLQGMARSAKKLTKMLGARDARACAAHATAMRIHPKQTVAA